LGAVGFRDLDGKLSCIMSFGSGGLGPWPDGRRKPIGESSGSQVTPVNSWSGMAPSVG